MINRSGYGILATLAMMAVGMTASQGQSALDYSNQALAKLQKGDTEGAIADCTTAIQLGPDDPNLYNLRGVAKRQKGDFAGAIEDFSKAIQVDPTKAGFYSNRGLARYLKKDLSGAVEDCCKAIDLKPGDPANFTNLGIVRNEQKEFTEAIVNYTKAIQLDPREAGNYAKRAIAKLNKMDYKGAFDDYTEAIILNSQDPVTRLSRGRLYYIRHEFTEAMADYQMAIGLNPGDTRPHFILWLIRARLGQKEAATKELASFVNKLKADGMLTDWSSQLFRFLSGQASESDFLKFGRGTDGHSNSALVCESYFYAGTVRLINGDRATAEEYFKKILGTKSEDFYDYDTVLAELQFMHLPK